ncbi:hypothetical protein J4455_05250 [Candidatus Woesearchaeota archaeon]|nr:hypothetical protein [Candidatus Woesearchaeota archaeon]
MLINNHNCGICRTEFQNGDLVVVGPNEFYHLMDKIRASMYKEACINRVDINVYLDGMAVFLEGFYYKFREGVKFSLDYDVISNEKQRGLRFNNIEDLVVKLGKRIKS